MSTQVTVDLPDDAYQKIEKEAVLSKLRDLKSELEKRYQITTIGIFGSVVRDEATEESDIDIVVEMQPDMLKRIGLKNELEALFSRKVDVVRYRQHMNPYLKSQIDQEAIYA